MKTKNQEETKETTRLTQTLQRIEEGCQNCYTLTPLKCTSGCNIWKLKKELRKLHEILTQKNYQHTLLNTLKNKRRLQILEILSRSTLSTTQLQKKLKQHGYYHSRKTIAAEYVEPLITVGLITNNSSRYKATLFGCEISQLITPLHKTEHDLPPHSECYEEKTIEALFENPKTYEELKNLVPTESLSRVLKRLQEANLVTKSDENSYIFHFKTKRKPEQEKLSPTERSVYKNIPEEGITAKKLAEKTKISLRRTYKYLRKLRGKKLVYKRKRPKTYALTRDGTQVATLLKRMHDLLTEFAQASAKITARPLEEVQQIPTPDIPKNSTDKPLQILVPSSA